MSLVPQEGTPISATSELVCNGTALAERRPSDRMPASTKALARAAVKFAAARSRDARITARSQQGDAPWVSLLVGVLAHSLAIASGPLIRGAGARCRMRFRFPAYRCRRANKAGCRLSMRGGGAAAGRRHPSG